MLRRIAAPLILTLFVLFAASGCTATQVQSWFSARGQTVSTSQASFIARALTIWEEQNSALLAYLTAVQNAAIPNEARWDRVAACESGGNWATNTGNGFYGGLQFSMGTWRGFGGSGYPHQNSKRDQIIVAERVRTQSGLGHWPHCGARF